MRTSMLLTAAALALSAMVALPADAAGVRMYVRHDVADYAAWRKVYDAFDATRRKMGVTAQAVYQSVDNPNDVTGAHDFKSLAEAKSFAASAELKAAMINAGVKGAPQIWFGVADGPAGADVGSNVRMFVHHEVADYATWRKNYDAFDARRRKMGVIGAAILRSADNPNDVRVSHDFKTVAEARTLAASRELKDAMATAGVKGAPQIWFTRKAAAN